MTASSSLALMRCLDSQDKTLTTQLDIPDILIFFKAIFQNFEGIQAILLYGSGLWKGPDAESVWDLHILADRQKDFSSALWPRLAGKLLPPNVYYFEIKRPDAPILRCKCNVMTKKQFSVHCKGRALTPHIWARFAQPCKIIYARNEDCRRQVLGDIANCVRHFTFHALPFFRDQVSQQGISSDKIWIKGLEKTYQCELRSESRHRANEITRSWADYLKARLEALSQEARAPLICEVKDSKRHFKSRLKFKRIRFLLFYLLLPFRKTIAFIRLLKSATTFENAVDYVLYKIYRHSGIYIPPSKFQRRHPLIAGWPLLWKLWRKGAFR